MQSYTIVVKGTLPALNEYIDACRGNRFLGAKMKKKAEERIRWGLALAGYTGIKISRPVQIDIDWFCPNKKKDKDNIAFAKKFILDALVSAGVLEGDGWKHIAGFSDSFYVDGCDPRVVITLTEQD